MDEKSKSKIDNLNRDKFINDLEAIISSLSTNKKNATFAIDGKWGVGKTWVLNKLEEDIGEDYLVIRYNAWENHFYDEPLVAILSVLADKLNELLKVQNTIKGLEKNVIQNILNIVGNIIGEITKNKFGFNIIEEGKKANKCFKSAEEEQKIDVSFDVNKTLSSLKLKIQECLANLAQGITIIVMVDELDRCLPKYAIKVLERLHHLFNGVENLQVIVSLDKSQVENTIKNIFGENVDKEKYLEKFFDFVLELDKGEIGNNFDIKYTDYCRYFDFLWDETTKKDIGIFKKEIFNGFDARTINKIIDKSMLLHKMLCDDKLIYDYTYFALEITSVIIVLNGNIITNGHTEVYHKEDVPLLNIDCYNRILDKVCKSHKNRYSTTPELLEYLFDPRSMWGIIWMLYADIYNLQKRLCLGDILDEGKYSKENFDKIRFSSEIEKKYFLIHNHYREIEKYFINIIDWINIIK